MKHNTEENNSEKKNSRKHLLRICLIIGLILISLITIIYFVIPFSLKAVFGHRMEVATQVLRDEINFTIPSSNIKSISTYQGIKDLSINYRYSQGLAINEDVEINLSIPNCFGSITTSPSYFNGFIFRNNVAPDIANKQKAWDKLENIGDISVCQLILYFSSPITAEELEKFLLDIDAKNKYAWAAIDTGNIPMHPKFGHYESYGFPMIVLVYGEDRTIKDDTVMRAAIDFQKEMKSFESECGYLGDRDMESELKAVNSYISNNGVKIKGVFVVAPTRNILKYKNSDLISNIDVIKAELDYKTEY